MGARLEALVASHQQCRKAFYQAPSPRLGNCLRQLEASIKYERRSQAKAKGITS